MNAAPPGRPIRIAPFSVDPERVAAFRAVFDEVTGVPATFATVTEFTVIPDIVADPELGLTLPCPARESGVRSNGR